MKLFIFYENDFPDLSFAQVYPGVRCWTRCWSYPIPRFAVRSGSISNVPYICPEVKGTNPYTAARCDTRITTTLYSAPN